MSEAPRSEEFPPSRERLGKPTPVVFYKVGGTWDMVEQEGRLIGTGNLDDNDLYRMEKSLGLLDEFNPEKIDKLELELLRQVYPRMKNTASEAEVGKHLSSWAKSERSGETVADYITGPFIPIYSGDSSHLRPALVAPITSILLDQANANPNKPILGAQGTDTADIAVLSLIDALIYDTDLPPVIFTGANRSHREEDSDAPRNFLDLAKLAHIDIRAINHQSPIEAIGKAKSGAFWVFHGNVYSASNLLKFDPVETRVVEGQSTFYSPYLRATQVFQFSGNAPWARLQSFETKWQDCKAPPSHHISQRSTEETIYFALTRVDTVNLGDQRRISDQVQQILDPRSKAVIIEAHGLGNVSNPIRAAAVEATKKGKLVFDVSRSLMGEVNTRYAGSLLDANEKELNDTGRQIISAHKLNKTAVRAIAARAILEGLDQEYTQKLITSYAQARLLI